MKTSLLALISLVLAAILIALACNIPLLARSQAGDSTPQIADPNQPAASQYDDEFNGPSLNPRWSWYFEDPTRWSLTAAPGNLRIIGTVGDVWFFCNNPKNLLLQPAPAGDFEIQTKLSIHPTTDFQQGGLILYSDLDNYIKLHVAWNSSRNGTIVEYIWESGGIPPFSWPQINVSLNQPVYLKLVKSGSLYAGYISTNGVNWTYVDAVSVPSLPNLKIGVFAMNSGPISNECMSSGPDIPADFDFFRVTVGTYSIGGRVVDVDNRPVTTATISTDTGVSTLPDANGYYTLTGLVAGTHVVRPYNATYTFAPSAYTVTVPPNVNSLDFVATPIKPVVVLVHGWQGLSPTWPTTYTCDLGATHYGTGGYFLDVQGNGLPKWLTDRGFDVWYAHLDTSILYTPAIEDNARCLSDQIANVVADDPAHQKVILIGHSMGGLVSRACLGLVDCRKNVSTLITLGSPNVGINSLLVLKILASQVSELGSFGVDVVCTLQPALCQFSAERMLLFNITQPNRAGITYNFIGGTDSTHQPGPLLQFLDGPNDGLVGSYSAVGWLYPTQYNMIPGPSAGRYWVAETHSEGIGHPSYFGNDAHTESQAMGCIAWLLHTTTSGDCPAAGLSTLNQAPASVDLPATTASLTGHLDNAQSVSHTLAIDASGHSLFHLSWLTGTVSFTLTQPDGQQITPVYAAGHSDVVTYSTGISDGEMPSYEAYAFTNTLPGVYTLTIGATNVGNGGINYLAFAAMETSLRMTITTDADVYLAGQTAVLTATLQNAGGGVAGASVRGYLARADGVTQTLAFADLGSGLYRATYLAPDAPGNMPLLVTASGTKGSITFTRQVEKLLAIAPQTTHLAGTYADRPADNNGDRFNDFLLLDVGVTATQVSTYTIAADLMASDTTVAHAVEYAVLAAGTQTITLRFDGWDIRRARLNGPYTVTNVYLIDTSLGGIPAQHANNVWTTATYSWRSFGSDNTYLPIVR